MQWATRANEAYQTLKKPLKRAAYLCELNGVDLQTESNTAMPPDFLMQQMEWREALDDAQAPRRTSTRWSSWTANCAPRASAQLDADRRSCSTPSDFARGGARRAALMFLEKFGEEVASHAFETRMTPN